MENEREIGRQDTDAGWMAKWREARIYQTPETTSREKKYYCLDMFPYPSGSGLHVGHVEGYTASDILSRYMRMNGREVLHPMGWDAFGLPAENYAVKTGVHPSITTDQAIKTFTGQIDGLGLSYDWSREIQTSKPEYYRWTQWFFLFLYKNGLAYKKKANVNWCEKCQTVLANEQAEGGVCERCGSKVIQKDLEQWFFKITDFIETREEGGRKMLGLIDGLDDIDWPDSTKAAQRNWIGKSVGAEFDLAIAGSDKKITVYTTRIDTVYGMSYVVLAPEHPILKTIAADNQAEIDEYVSSARGKTELDRIEAKEKTGVEIKGVRAVNPFTQAEVPIFVADYVLFNYGTGAIMAVPAHDDRDLAFARKYGLPVLPVIASEADKDRTSEELSSLIDSRGIMTDDGILVESGEYSGLASAVAREKMNARLESEGIGRAKVNYKLRDWLVSRQRYWGSPIPIVYCPVCGEVPLPESELPVLLPDDVDFKPTGESPLVHSKSFHARKCPKCGGDARMESDTMDTFVCSSWYYFRYLDPHNDKEFTSREAIQKWMPVDVYIGGAEHSVLHLLYSRFFTKALERHGYIDFSEPFLKLRHQGIILAEDGTKMSKSKGNVINPDDVVRQYGADCLRLHEMFLGAFEDYKPWSTKAIIGIKRFLDKIRSFADKIEADEKLSLAEYDGLNRSLHRAIKKAGEDIVGFKFNTAISQLMILSNEFGKHRTIPRSYYEKLLLVLAPFAPFTAEDLWSAIGNGFSIHREAWPTYDEALTKLSEVPVAVQINGKTRGVVMAEQDEEETGVVGKVQADERLSEYVKGGYKKVIFVKNKIVNFIV